MTDKIKKRIMIPYIVGAIIGGIIGFVAAVIQLNKERRDPLYYCLWEIHTHEDYDCDFTYFYEELEPKSEIRKEADPGCDLYAYYITTFTDDRKGEWYCFIECKSNSIFKGYNPEEVVLIDCDIAIETFYGEYVYEP